MTEHDTRTPATEDKKPIPLRCCLGEAAPQQVVNGWRAFESFGAEARAKFWGVLGRALIDPASVLDAELLEPFCRENAVAIEAALAAVRSCEFLLRRASAIDMPKAAFEDDLEALSGGDLTVAEGLLTRYDFVKTGLRQQILQGTLTDHGKLLVGLGWRVDNVSVSDRGTGLDTTVVFMTLRYVEGGKGDAITLQLTPEALGDLKKFMHRFGS